MTAPKNTNFPGWYQEVCLKAELIEYYNEVRWRNVPAADCTSAILISLKISGFFILRPNSMFIWNVIRKWFQEGIENMGVEEVSFPMFLSKTSLDKEKDHVEGFAPE